MSKKDPNWETGINDNRLTQPYIVRIHAEDHIENTTRKITDFPSRKDEFTCQIESNLPKEESAQQMLLILDEVREASWLATGEQSISLLPSHTTLVDR